MASCGTVGTALYSSSGSLLYLQTAWSSCDVRNGWVRRKRGVDVNQELKEGFLRFEWQKPIALTHNGHLIFREDDFAQIENRPGVYFFARNFGDISQPFYIGETLRLRSSLKLHLTNYKIMQILKGENVPGVPSIGNGFRSFHFGYLSGNKQKTAKEYLRVAEKFMIETAIAEDLPLLNKKLTAGVKTRSLIFEGNKSYMAIYKQRNTVMTG
jgi:hypothetical protein